ncbi:hypothetical protein DL346_18690 [Paenibacillus montanisoli]|uniref:Uncharacterized protein n=1 Tax=Paenibacillus montanisoli TaxID=2081970 RepID=A0A328TYZ0_9BACL|nr:hypothetical protein DL346_18690 [Paenibacillus montanisoli]
MIAGLCIGIALVIFLPKRFQRKHTFVYFMCGVYSGFFFDHSLSVQPVSFYDVNDRSSYQLIDFVSYISYGPISYLFFYTYDRLRPKPSQIAIFILIWSLVSTGLEWLAVCANVFHYRFGYKLAYSFPIYLIVQSCWIFLYHRLESRRASG